MNQEKIHQHLKGFICNSCDKKALVLELNNSTKDKLLENFEQGDNYLIEHSSFSKEKEIEKANYIEAYQADIDVTSISNFALYHNKFDYIISKNFFEYLRYPTQILIDYKTLLNPNGSFLFSLPNISHISMKTKLLRNTFAYDNTSLLQEDNIHLFTYKTIAEMLAHASLVVEECSFLVLDEVPHSFDTYFENIPKQAAKAIINDLNSYVSHYIIKAKPINADLFEVFQHNYKTMVLTDKNATSEVQMQKISLLKELNNTIAST